MFTLTKNAIGTYYKRYYNDLDCYIYFPKYIILGYSLIIISYSH